jgi:sugar lactone lactonase YvrE
MERLTPDYTVVGAANSLLGEGPVWDWRSDTLRYLDITGKKLHAIDWSTGALTRRELPQMAGCVGLTAGCEMVLAMTDGIYVYDRGQLTLAHPPQDISGERFNDGKPGPDGRFYAGTIGMDGRGKLYVLDKAGELRVLLTGVSISNGLDWSLDERYFYYCDTVTRRIDRYDFDAERGAISNPRTVVTIPEGMGGPDSLTVDAEGMLWIALWGAGGVLRADPSAGKLLACYAFPARKTSCPVFAGKDLSTLVVTSAGEDEDVTELPLSGCAFSIETDFKGRLPFLCGVIK